MPNPELVAILRQLQSTKFRDLAGAQVSAVIPVSERLINDIVRTTLPRSGHIREAYVRPESGNRFAVRIAPRAAFIPPITVRLEIERQPELPAAPVLVVRMATMGGLFGIATAVLPVGQMLPSGVRLDGEHIHVDLRAIAAERGFADVFDYIRQLNVTTEDGRALVRVEVSA